MANELTLSASAQFADSLTGKTFGKAVEGYVKTVSTKKPINLVQAIGTSEEALTLGDVATLGYVLFLNWDTTNFVSIRSGTGTENMVRVDPADANGNPGMALFRFGSGATAPYAIADTAAVDLEMLLFPA